MNHQPAHDRYNSEQHPARPFGSALTKGDGAMVERCPRIGPTVRLRNSPPCPVCGNNGRYHCECEVEDGD